MPENDRIHQLVEAALDGSRTPEEVCAECPELLPAVAQRLGQIHGLNADLQNLFPAKVASTVTDNSQPKTLPSCLPSIPGYDVLGVLGRGGMGVVYKAKQDKLNRLVALKMILAGSHAGPAELARFQTEGEAIARLQHPNIVQVHEIGEHDGKPFFSLEFCGGGSLDKKLNGTPLPPEAAAALVETLARAMQAAHDKDVIHRDLKPGNVLLSDDGTPKITDFGLAKKLDETGLTGTGAIMGSAPYMAPEQASGNSKKIGPATDVYALGAILYECLTGRPPFKAATTVETIRQVVTDEPVPPSRLQTKTPRDLETICLKCLRKEPEQRDQSAEALAEDLARFRRGEPIKARPVGGLERGIKWVRRNPVVAGLLTAVVVVLVLGSVVSTYFGFEAIHQAEEASAAQHKAENEKIAANAAKTTAETQKQRADNAKTTAEGALKQLKEEKQKVDAARLKAVQEKERAEGLVYSTQLSLAQSAFAEGKGAVALQRLEECQWNLRGWEHDHLWTRYNAKQTLFGHQGGVFSVAFSPDGKRILTGSNDNTAKVWDAQTGQELLSLKGHKGGVFSVAFSPDGKRILTGSWDMTAKVWDADKGQDLFSLQGHTALIWSVAFSSDGKRILTGSNDTLAKVWDAQTGVEVFSLKGPTCGVFSPDGKRILTGSGDGKAKLWDAQAGQEILNLVGHDLRVNSVAFSPDGKRLVTSSDDKTARVWDAQTGREIFSVQGHASHLLGLVTSAIFSPDGKHILTGSGDNSARLWDAKTGQEIFSLRNTGQVSSVAFNPDGKRILTGDLYGTAKVWDAQAGQEILTLKGVGPVGSVRFNPEGDRILTGNYDGTAKVCDAQTGQEIFSVKKHNTSVTSVAFSSDGKRILIASSDGAVQVWDAQTGKELPTIQQHTGLITNVAVSPDGKRMFTASADKTAKVFDLQTGQEIFSFQDHKSSVSIVAVSLDGKRIVTRSLRGAAKVWDAEKRQELYTLQKHSGQITSVAFSPDGKRIITGSGTTSTPPGTSGEAKIWNAETGQEILSLKGHTNLVTCVAFSPDGKRIVTGSYDMTVRIWNAETGKEVLLLKGHTGAVTSVAFSSDGKRLVSGSADMTVRIWSAEKSQKRLTLHGDRNLFTSLAFSPDSQRLFAWDTQNKVLAWSLRDGQPIEADNPPTAMRPPAISPDGKLRAEPRGNEIVVFDPRRLAEDNFWPLPDTAERQRYHTEQATLAEKDNQWFAVAFHLNRLLLDNPDDPDLKQRRDEALRRHVGVGPAELREFHRD